jgi:long-chain acyl-CoA synthetase
MTETTILHQLLEKVEIYPDQPAYYEKQEGTWVATNWKDYVAQVRQASGALISLGFEPGDCVAILGFNRPEWAILCLSSMLAGGHSAGIYATNSPSEVQFIIEDSESKIILVEDSDQLEKVREVRDQLPGLKHVVLMRGVMIEDPMVLDWDSFMSRGKDIDRQIIIERMDEVSLGQLATLIYTSGTTGPPKGVMLSHENLTWVAETGTELFDINPSDSVLSYNPLSHIAEQMFTVHIPAIAGYRVYYAQFPPQKYLNNNFREVSPTLVFAVPRVWERFAGAVQNRLDESSGLKARIAKWALGVGNEVSTLTNKGDTPSAWLEMKHAIADRLVFSNVKKALGFSNLRHCLTGAAPVAPEIIEFFNSLDIPLTEIYGQSEGSGPTTISRPGANRIGKVGQAWPGVQVEIAEDGEILVKGLNVFMGYYKNPEDTASTLVDGWLHTGDLGKFDMDGFLSIIGRKKEIFITSGGLNIAPKNIEAALMNLSLVSIAVCLGDKQRYITALLSLNAEAMEKFCQEHSLEGKDLHAHPKVITAIQTAINEEVNTHLSRAERVRDFRIISREFSLTQGELTPTLKIKRRVVNEHFHDEIMSMYSAE